MLRRRYLFRPKCSTGTFWRSAFPIGFHKGERSCSLPLEILSDFSPLSPRAESIAQGVSPSADGDKGCSPLTSSAFLRKSGAKNFYTRVRSHGRYPPSLVGGSVCENSLANETVGGVDDPAARWFLRKKRRKKLLYSCTLSRALPTLPCGRVSRQKSPCQRSGGRGRRSSGTLVG
jgi:hypothetical protein